MFDILKKLGVPATVALVVSSLITFIPIIFKIDKRYAKTEEVSTHVEELQQQIFNLTIEVGRVTGVQKALLDILIQQEQHTNSTNNHRNLYAPPRSGTSSPSNSTSVPFIERYSTPPTPSVPSYSDSSGQTLHDMTKQLENIQTQISNISKNVEQIKKR